MTQNATLIFDSLFLHETQMTDLEREQTTLRKIYSGLTGERARRTTFQFCPSLLPSPGEHDAFRKADDRGACRQRRLDCATGLGSEKAANPAIGTAQPMARRRRRTVRLTFMDTLRFRAKPALFSGMREISRKRCSSGLSRTNAKVPETDRHVLPYRPDTGRR